MKHADLIGKLKALVEPLALWLPERETCPCPHCVVWRELDTLIRDLEAVVVVAERSGPIGLSQIEVFKNDGVLCFDHGMHGHPRYPDCHVQVTRA